MDEAVACCSLSISGASLSRDKVSAASGVCFEHWRFLELWLCLVDLSRGIQPCYSSRMIKCTSSLFMVCSGGDLISGGINTNCQFFRSPGAGAIRIVQWSFCSSYSNTLPTAPDWGSSVNGFIIVIGQHVPVLMMLMNLVVVWCVFEYGDRVWKGGGSFSWVSVLES